MCVGKTPDFLDLNFLELVLAHPRMPPCLFLRLLDLCFQNLKPGPDKRRPWIANRDVLVAAAGNEKILAHGEDSR